MLPMQQNVRSRMLFRSFSLALLSAAAATLGWNPAEGHELWVEAPASGAVGKTFDLDVCWGHSGERASGPGLEGQQDKLGVQMIEPDGSRSDLETVFEADCFRAKVAPRKPGYHVVGGELQTGIIARPMHEIPENTRIIMYGKALTHVAGGEEGIDRALGHDLELVLLTAPSGLKPGAVVKARVLLQGKPLGGRNVEVTLNTAGSRPAAADTQVQSPVWSTYAAPHPKTGEVAFSLIAGGTHWFLIRYTDQTPGVYQGDRNDSSTFSHLRKGDTFEQTMYVATLTVQVSDN